jgi:HD-like signal output (HDOD) protein/CheY-like chemotaxis protein
MDEKRILIADADPRAVEAFREALGEPWTVVGVASGSAALAEMKQQPYEVLIADLNLPELKDAELLNRVRRKYPKTVRIIAASSGDRERVVKRALGAHQFLHKPFDPKIIKDTINRALASDAWIDNDRLRELISRVRTLPTVPSAYLEITAVLRSASATTTEVSEIIARDMAMTTKLLQVVNSAYFGLPQKITEPEEAVAILGFETIKSMVMAIKLLGFYDKIKPGTFSIESVWQHSTAVAQTAKAIVIRHTNDRSLAEVAFTGGLMHDLGKAILAANFDEQYAGAQSLARKQQMPMPEIEIEIFGATHGEIGAYLLGLWGMPMDLLEIAALHHVPSRSGNKCFNALTAVHLANVFEHEKSPDLEVESMPQLDEDYLTEIGVLHCVEGWRREFGNPDLIHIVELPKLDAPPSDEPLPRPAEGAPVPDAATVIEPAPDSVIPVAESELEVSPPQRQPRRLMAVAAVLLLLALFWGITVALQSSDKIQTVRARPADKDPAAELLADGAANLPADEANPLTANQSDTQESANISEPLTVAPVPEPAALRESVEVAVEKPIDSVPPFPDLRLQGIILSSRNPSVIINGHTLYQNELWNGVRVIEIGSSNVVVEFQATRKTLNLRSNK